MLAPHVNIALRAARQAGQLIRRAAEDVQHLTVEKKGLNDYVSEVDRAAEARIIEVLQKAYPRYGILAEESGEISGQGDDARWQWIIDPLDGTTNFLHGFPQFAVSIALACDGKIEHGVIYDPLREEEFTASRGRGAALNGRRLRVASRAGLEGALIGTGFPFRKDQAQHVEAYMKMLQDIMSHTAGLRRAGSAALDLAWVAAGRMDGFWEIGLQEWDMAAGSLLITEAGGLVGDLTGGHKHLQSGHIVGGNPKVFKALLQKIQPHLTDALRR
ncbi:MAG: inositol monophosphatase [Alcanivorax sp.]|nr:inositol monophosphatase [Alcanivorax sp.]